MKNIILIVLALSALFPLVSYGEPITVKCPTIETLKQKAYSTRNTEFTVDKLKWTGSFWKSGFEDDEWASFKLDHMTVDSFDAISGQDIICAYSFRSILAGSTLIIRTDEQKIHIPTTSPRKCAPISNKIDCAVNECSVICDTPPPSPTV